MAKDGPTRPLAAALSSSRPGWAFLLGSKEPRCDACPPAGSVVSSGNIASVLGSDRLEGGVDVRIGCRMPEALCRPVVNLDSLPSVLEINMPLFF